MPTGEPQDGDFRLLDTFDGSIARAGSILVERRGELRLLGNGGAGTVQPARRTVGFVGDMAEGPIRQELGEVVSPLRRLLPIGKGRASLRSHSLLDEVDKTQARLELLTLDGENGRTLTLATVEGLRGYDKAFADLRDGLLGEAGESARICDARALLFPDDVEPYDAKPDVAMSPDERACTAATDIARAHLAVARRNEDGAVADLDSEFLHDYRVALRKVRSVLSLFQGVYGASETPDLKERFAALMAPTARLRDLDVYLLERENYLAMLPEALRPGLEPMFAAFARERRNAHRRLARHFRDEQYMHEVTALQTLFAEGPAPGPMADRPALDYAKELIWKRYRNVCKIARGITDDTPDEEVHRLRIQCKKLRYLMEFFTPLFGAEVRPLAKALKKLQDNLGAFNDYSVQQASLDTYLGTLRESRAGRKVEIARSAGALIAMLHQRQLQERGRIVESFERFDAPSTQQGFQRLFRSVEDAS